MSSMNKNRKLLTVVLVLLCSTAAVLALYFFSGALRNPLFGGDAADGFSSANIDAQTGSSFNALLIGLDKGGEHCDAIMLIHVDKEDKAIRMLSVPRDTRIKLDGKNVKINVCYRRGGADLLIEQVKALTDVEINYYAVVEPGMLAEIVDCLGGVEYDVERDMKYSDPTQDLYIDLKAGPQTLDGDKAEQYCRFRSYLMGDITRTQSQQKFFKALFEQKLTVSNAPKIREIYSIMSDKVKTNVSLMDVLSNLYVLKLLSDGGTIECIDVPGHYNDMQKEGVSYYLLEGDDVEELKKLCSGSFDGYYM